MSKLHKYIEQINNQDDLSIFYLANDVERAMGLESLLGNYHIIASESSQVAEILKQNKIKCFVPSIQTNNSIKLIKSEEFKEYYNLNKNTTNFIQTFKISPAFENSVRQLNATSLNTSGRLNRLFENKISQYYYLKDIEIKIPDTIIINLSNANYSDLSSKFGNEFIVQFNRGHTGDGTIFVKDNSEFNDLKSIFPNRDVKISKFVDGIAYTINCCVGKTNTYVGGLSYQITGIKELTNNLGGTVGNDWYYREGITKDILSKIITYSTQIGELMRKEGYLGMFGLDLIITADDVYIIEINARQPASIPMYTKMQITSEEVPLSLIHLMEYVGIDYDIDSTEYNIKNTEPLNYSQIFNRAKSEVNVRTEIPTGNYHLRGDSYIHNNDSAFKLPIDEDMDKILVLENKYYSIDKIIDNSSFILLCPKLNKIVSQGQELIRIQLNSSAMKDHNVVHGWIIESLVAVEKHII
jgi:glutathione synthase/RimK-type ligase-like ATP-grasp enzyme